MLCQLPVEVLVKIFNLFSSFRTFLRPFFGASSVQWRFLRLQKIPNDYKFEFFKNWCNKYALEDHFWKTLSHWWCFCAQKLGFFLVFKVSSFSFEEWKMEKQSNVIGLAFFSNEFKIKIASAFIMANYEQLATLEEV